VLKRIPDPGRFDFTEERIIEKKKLTGETVLGEGAFLGSEVGSNGRGKRGDIRRERKSKAF